MPFEIVRNDITRMRTDAIVNAANNSLLGGGGVDGAIHRAAGPGLLEECRKLGGCLTGQAKITGGYNLPARYVIHTVGPVWRGGGQGEEELLASCYRESLLLAEKHGCESVAFPLISAGAYGYPKDRALRAATDTIRDFLLEHEMYVYLVIYGREAFAISTKLYANIREYITDEHIPPEFERAQMLRRQRLQSRPFGELKEAAAKPDWNLPDADMICAAPFPAAGAAPKETVPGPEEDLEMCAAPEGLDEYLKQIDEGFRDMLLRKIDEKQITDAECYKKANIDRKLFNKIKNQEGYKPGKTTVLALSVSLELPLEETREMLSKAGFSLSRSSVGDLIVEYFIRQGNYDIFEINEALFAFDQKLLGSAM